MDNNGKEVFVKSGIGRLVVVHGKGLVIEPHPRIVTKPAAASVTIVVKKPRRPIVGGQNYGGRSTTEAVYAPGLAAVNAVSSVTLGAMARLRLGRIAEFEATGDEHGSTTWGLTVLHLAACQIATEIETFSAD